MFMSTDPNPKRPLSSLNREECQALFAVAFGYAPLLGELQIFSLRDHIITISSLSRSLALYADGQVCASDKADNRDSAIAFNAYKLLSLLQHHNILFGSTNSAVL